MKRKAFSLIELLAVIAIIAILIAIMLPVVSGVRRTAFNAQVAVEMQQVTTVAGMFSGYFGIQPMVNGGGPNGEFRLCSNYSDTSWPEAQYLKRLFPNADFADNGLRVKDPSGVLVSVPSSNPELLDGNQALVFWLSGGTYTNYRGFSLNRQKPFTPPASVTEDRKKWMDFDQSRMYDANGIQDNRWRDPHKVPYAVLGFNPISRTFPTNVTCFGVRPYERDGKIYNSGTIQIICAGMNDSFGPGGILTPGVGAWKSPNSGYDDLANFRQQMLGDDDR